MNPNYPLTKLRIARILALLEKSDLDKNQIAEKVHMGRTTAAEYVKLMVTENLVHIPRWAQPGGLYRHIPVLRAGPGISVPRPQRMPDEVRNKRWRAKLKGDAERAERLRRGRNARRRKIIPDPLLAWIPVRPARSTNKDAS